MDDHLRNLEQIAQQNGGHGDWEKFSAELNRAGQRPASHFERKMTPLYEMAKGILIQQARKLNPFPLRYFASDESHNDDGVLTEGIKVLYAQCEHQFFDCRPGIGYVIMLPDGLYEFDQLHCFVPNEDEDRLERPRAGSFEPHLQSRREFPQLHVIYFHETVKAINCAFEEQERARRLQVSPEEDSERAVTPPPLPPFEVAGEGSNEFYD